MEPKVILKLMAQLNEHLVETKTLYEISDAELPFLTAIIVESPSLGLTPQTTAKLLKAAAHFIEESYETTNESIKQLFK